MSADWLRQVRGRGTAADAIVPDLPANADGITVSYFEWAQD